MQLILHVVQVFRAVPGWDVNHKMRDIVIICHSSEGKMIYITGKTCIDNKSRFRQHSRFSKADKALVVGAQGTGHTGFLSFLNKKLFASSCSKIASQSFGKHLVYSHGVQNLAGKVDADNR